MSPPVCGGEKNWEIVWIFKRKPTGTPRNETDSGRGSNTSQGLLCWQGGNSSSGLFLQGVENLRTSGVGC